MGVTKLTFVCIKLTYCVYVWVLYSCTVDPHISEGNVTDPTSYMLKIRI